MADFLSRGISPLSDQQWQLIDSTVTDVARHSLVGRRFIPLFGPLGPGVQTVITDVYAGLNTANVSMLGEEPGAEIVRAERRSYTPLPIIYKDFRLHWRDIETSERFGVELDTSPAAAAAVYCAYAEDNLIFNGNQPLGYEGLVNATDRSVAALSDWGQVGRAFADVVAATELLTSEGFYGPYALVVSPVLYADMNRIFDNTGVLEIEQIRKIATDGVFQTPVLPEPSAVVVTTGPQNLDLVVGQDLTTAFLMAQEMNYYLRVFETILLRIKRPQAICTLESGAHPPRGGRRQGTREETQAGT